MICLYSGDINYINRKFSYLVKNKYLQPSVKEKLQYEEFLISSGGLTLKNSKDTLSSSRPHIQ